MRRALVAILALQLVLEGCTTVKPPPKVDVPVAWAQKSEEIGKLQAGEIIAVNLEQLDDSNYVPSGIKTTIVVPIGGIFVPMNLTTSGGPSSFKKMQQFYRYSIQQKGMDNLSYWDDFVVYPIGSCVALREHPYTMIVPALPQECE